MTNEQLAEFIQKGNAEDLKPVLYERVKHLMYKLVGVAYMGYKDRFCACGVELCDLRAERYPAYLKALKSYKTTENYKFIAYLRLHIKTSVSELLGIRNAKRLNNSPLDNAISLDMPLKVEDDNLTFGDTLVDENSEQAFENALDCIYDQQVKQVLHKALNSLEEPLRDIIVLNYFKNVPQREIAERYGKSTTRINQLVHKALKTLRAMPEIAMLREEQRVEKSLHFTSQNTSRAYYKAQEQIAEILKRGEILSYGKRQAIIFDCEKIIELEESKRVDEMSEIDKLIYRFKKDV